MDNINYQNIDAFIQVINDIVKETLKSMQIKTEQYYDGLVTNVSTDNKKASVDIGDTVLSDLPNKTNEQLHKYDTVRVFTTTITNSDAYIGVRLNDLQVPI